MADVACMNMSTQLLQRIDSLLDNILLGRKNPLGARECLEEEVDKVKEEAKCDVCHKTCMCKFKCRMCREYFCTKRCLDLHRQ